MRNLFKTILFTTILLISTNSFAQGDDSIDPDIPPTDPGTAAPIDDYIPLLLIGAASMGLLFIKKDETANVL